MHEPKPTPGPGDYQRAEEVLREALTEAELLSVAGVREEIAELAAAARVEPPAPTGPLADLLCGEVGLDEIQRSAGAQASAPVVDLAASRRRRRRGGFTAGFAIVALGAAGIAGTAAADSDRPEPPEISLVVHVSPKAEPTPLDVPLVESSAAPTTTGTDEAEAPLSVPGDPSTVESASSTSESSSASDSSADRSERAERNAAQEAEQAERARERAERKTAQEARKAREAAERQAGKAAQKATKDQGSGEPTVKGKAAKDAAADQGGKGTPKKDGK